MNDSMKADQALANDLNGLRYSIDAFLDEIRDGYSINEGRIKRSRQQLISSIRRADNMPARTLLDEAKRQFKIIERLIPSYNQALKDGNGNAVEAAKRQLMLSLMLVKNRIGRVIAMGETKTATPFLDPIPDGAKAAKLDAAGLASRLQRLSASFQGHATSAGREMNSAKYLIDELKHKSLIIAKHKDAAARMGATQASATLGKARQNIMRGIYWIMNNNSNEAMQVLYKVALELNEASKEVRRLV